jgi:hypothetical protein
MNLKLWLTVSIGGEPVMHLNLPSLTQARWFMCLEWQV